MFPKTHQLEKAMNLVLCQFFPSLVRVDAVQDIFYSVHVQTVLGLSLDAILISQFDKCFSRQLSYG
jgi:hypothetical protein